LTHCPAEAPLRLTVADDALANTCAMPTAPVGSTHSIRKSATLAPLVATVGLSAFTITGNVPICFHNA